MSQSSDKPPGAGCKVAVNLGELLSTREFEFELNPEDADLEEEEEAASRSDLVLDYSTLQEHVNFDCIEASDPEALPFEELETKMRDISADGQVKKRVLRAGSVPLPEDATVRIHYNLYTEMEEIPFDSSYLRSETPVRYQMGQGLFLGFEIALMSMAVGEKAQFLIHPDLAFGKLGCHPRIPPNATIMAIVEVFRLDHSPHEEPLSFQNQKNFTVAYDRAKRMNKEANTLVCDGKVFVGLALYRKAERLLLGCTLDNDEQEAKYKKLLLKIYSNMAICYNSPLVKQPKRACVAITNAFQLDPKTSSKNPKLFYNRGVALMALAEYGRARVALMKARRLRPDDENINKQLGILERKVESRKEHEEIVNSSVFGFPESPVDNVPPVPEDIDEECKAAASLLLEEFAQGNDARLPLPSEYTPAEREWLRAESERLGLKYVETPTAFNRFDVLIAKKAPT